MESMNINSTREKS